MAKQCKSYICPACKEKQTTVRHWETISVGHDFNLATNEFSGQEDARSDSADHEDFACPSCGEEFDQALIEKLGLWERI